MIRKSFLVGAVSGACVVAAAFADSPSPFVGTWLEKNGVYDGKPSRATVTFTTLDERTVKLAAELVHHDGKLTFDVTGARKGDEVAFDAPLKAAGFLDKLGGLFTSQKRIAGRYVYRSDAPLGDRIEGTYTIGSKTGRDVLFIRGAGWTEVPLAGSWEKEAALIAGFTDTIRAIQTINANGAAEVSRGFHAKGTGARAELRVRPDLPGDLAVDVIQAGARLPALVRLSNASGKAQSDAERDLRGIAVRVKTGAPRALLSGETAGAQDFLATSFPTSHARDPEQFMFIAKAMADGDGWIGKVGERYGPLETARVLGNFARGTGKPDTFASESYFSRAPIRWGRRAAVKFRFRPHDGAGKGQGGQGADRLSLDLERRLATGEMRFDLEIQFFADEKRTPIEDGAVEWKEKDAPFVKVAELVLLKQDLGAAATAFQKEIDALAFNPWNATEDFRPIGSLMRARKDVYKASATKRKCPFGFGG